MSKRRGQSNFAFLSLLLVSFPPQSQLNPTPLFYLRLTSLSSFHCLPSSVPTLILSASCAFLVTFSTHSLISRPLWYFVLGRKKNCLIQQKKIATINDSTRGGTSFRVCTTQLFYQFVKLEFCRKWISL